VREVQLDAVEPGGGGARRGGGEQPGQHRRQRGDVRQVGIGDALAVAERQVLALALVEDRQQRRLGQRRQRRAHGGLWHVARVARQPPAPRGGAR
jgi:hypothetical protein